MIGYFKTLDEYCLVFNGVEKLRNDYSYTSYTEGIVDYDYLKQNYRNVESEMQTLQSAARGECLRLPPPSHRHWQVLG